jgi:hypothetical protein
MLAFLQSYSPPAFHASACAPRVLLVSIRLMKSDGAILITHQLEDFGYHSGVTMSQSVTMLYICLIPEFFLNAFDGILELFVLEC